MKLRGKIARRLGLAHEFDRGKPISGEAPADDDCLPGVRIGPFTVQSAEKDELIVGDDDKHLDFRISTFKQEREGAFFITVSTAVQIHNRLGRIYMAFVTPFHRVLAPLMIRRAVKAGKL